MALEGLARYVGGFSEARATIGLALWYPLLVLSLAYALFLGMVGWAVPRFIEAFNSLGLTLSAPLRWLGRLGEWSGTWWPVGPIFLLVVAIAWFRSGRLGAVSVAGMVVDAGLSVDELDPGEL